MTILLINCIQIWNHLEWKAAITSTLILLESLVIHASFGH